MLRLSPMSPSTRPIIVTSFFFNDTATTEIYTLSLHDALPLSCACTPTSPASPSCCSASRLRQRPARRTRSEEHTSELQSRPHLVCRLLLEKKKKRGRTNLFTYKNIYWHN